jgi:phosphatidylglycerol---prolipoprotein diacylglyceryl transferase
MTIDRYGIHIGVLFIHFYGIILMLGVLAAAVMSDRRARNSGKDPEVLWDMLSWLVIGGVIGARFWHILTPPASMVEQGITFQYYMTHPLDALAIWKGGLGIPGAVAGGALALLFYTRRKKLSFLKWVDIIAPGLALAQAIGRFGNFVNQELYGLPSDLPWAIYIEPMARVSPYLNIEYFHPLFLYEALWNIMNMAILIWLGKRFMNNLKDGDIFLSYLIVYPVGRFLLEYLRLDPSPVAGMNANQTLMAVIAVTAGVLLLARHRNPKNSKSPELYSPENNNKSNMADSQTASTEENSDTTNTPQE